jgi:hypothetical protein
VQQVRGKVIEVDFTQRRRLGAPPPRVVKTPPNRQRRALQAASEFVVLWRPPARREAAEYLGGRWDWGWTLFVWTSEATVGPMRADLATRGYLAQWLTREGFLSFLHRATEIGGVLFDGELEDGGARIRAEPQQLVRRLDAVTALD